VEYGVPSANFGGVLRCGCIFGFIVVYIIVQLDEEIGWSAPSFSSAKHSVNLSYRNQMKVLD
jgi:hypothetical protein